MRYLSVFFLCTILILWSSCREDFESGPSVGQLEFSVDTLFLDTIFTNISSETYSFKIYNRTDEDFTIPNIALERGDASNYRLNVDGIPGKSFENIQVLAKDSIFVFVETTTDILDQTSALEFLYTDKVLFDPNGVQQDVDLVTLIKDAIFLFPSRDPITRVIDTLAIDGEKLNGFALNNSQLNFTAEKPYVIYGYAAIPSGETLTIDAGARIHFHANSGIIAAAESTLLVNGELSTDAERMENEVIFEGDRLEPRFSNQPGQWGRIWLTTGSKAVINHATIKNASFGVRVESFEEDIDPLNPALIIRNTQIYNSLQYGILSIGGHIVGENVVVNNSGLSGLRCSFGGTYEFDHCTFTGYGGNSFRSEPTVLIENFIELGGNQGIINDLIKANFNNCIIDGSNNIEFLLRRVTEASFNFNFKNCLIKFEDIDETFANDPIYDFTNIGFYQNIIANEDPDFKNPEENELNIGEDSAANGQADPATPAGTDLLGTARSATAPDLGAYESVMFEATNP